MTFQGRPPKADLQRQTCRGRPAEADLQKADLLKGQACPVRLAGEPGKMAVPLR